MNLDFSIWIASKKKWAHLHKEIQLEVIPRVGEYIKFSCIEYDYVPWKIKQITYQENGKIEIWTDLLDNINNRYYSFEDDKEFLDCYNAFINSNWICEEGIRKNTKILNAK